MYRMSFACRMMFFVKTNRGEYDRPGTFATPVAERQKSDEAYSSMNQ